MIKSMTGFGKATCEFPEKKINIEIKTINSKQLDIYTKIPSYYKEKEIDLRQVLSKFFIRGKIEFSISVDIVNIDAQHNLNTELIKSYYAELSKLSNELKLNTNNTDLLAIIMKLPEVLTYEKKVVNEDEWAEILKCIDKAIENTDKFRCTEGIELKKDIDSRINNIKSLLNQINCSDASRKDEIREKLLNAFKENLQNIEFNKNRFEEELIYYIEKLDINEEKVRLESHCKYFIDTINDSEEIKGKKLNFIAQEIGREINTIGSKINNAEIQKIVVQMKDELEKIKEQTANLL